MKDIDKKFFWLTNLIAPFIVGYYFYSKEDNWLGIIVPVYCIIYWLCAISFLEISIGKRRTQ